LDAEFAFKVGYMKLLQNQIPYRFDRLIQERVHDPYKTKSKPSEPSVCPVCHAVFKDGRWQWADSWPIDAHTKTCQACHHVSDGSPAGVISLRGEFAQNHSKELLQLIRHREQGENREHPLHRIMQIEEKPESIVIKTTDIHLPHAIGEALRRAYKGHLAIRYSEETYFVEVKWSR
jgi:NMD protein affecting ribosome stability and mRNA decay